MSTHKFLLICFVAGCSSTPSETTDGAVAPDLQIAATPDLAMQSVDWEIPIDPAKVAGPLPDALLGQYDLSGALFDYPNAPGLTTALAPMGFTEWRVGVGRWEFATRLLPTLTDGTPCPQNGYPPAAFAPMGATDADLIAGRDWFTDDGNPVTMQDTTDDKRYSLAYLRSVLDAATKMGARPYVDVDLMPRALAVNKVFSRTAGLPDQCNATWANDVSNVAPADPTIFAAAARGMISRIVEGSGGEPARPAQYWEIWNEFELPYAWDTKYDDMKHDAFFAMAIDFLATMRQYRTGSASPTVQALRFGLGSFANPDTAAAVLTAFDQANAGIPVDFVSFHGYAPDGTNDPLTVVAGIEKVAAARAATTNYRDTELVLSEWGTNLDAAPDPSTIETPLYAATVIALGAAQGLGRMHHAIFYAFYPGVPYALVDNSGQPLPLGRAYQLMAELVGANRQRLIVTGFENGRLDGGMGALLGSKDAGGALRVLMVNRESVAKTARFTVGGSGKVPTRVEVFDVAAQPIHDVAPSTIVTIPARSLVLVSL
jgi:hypothetical protein